MTSAFAQAGIGSGSGARTPTLRRDVSCARYVDPDPALADGLEGIRALPGATEAKQTPSDRDHQPSRAGLSGDERFASSHPASRLRKTPTRILRISPRSADRPPGSRPADI